MDFKTNLPPIPEKFEVGQVLLESMDDIELLWEVESAGSDHTQKIKLIYNSNPRSQYNEFPVGESVHYCMGIDGLHRNPSIWTLVSMPRKEVRIGQKWYNRRTEQLWTVIGVGMRKITCRNDDLMLTHSRTDLLDLPEWSLIKEVSLDLKTQEFRYKIERQNECWYLHLKTGLRLSEGQQWKTREDEVFKLSEVTILSEGLGGYVADTQGKGRPLLKFECGDYTLFNGWSTEIIYDELDERKATEEKKKMFTQSHKVSEVVLKKIDQETVDASVHEIAELFGFIVHTKRDGAMGFRKPGKLVNSITATPETVEKLFVDRILEDDDDFEILDAACNFGIVEKIVFAERL